MSPKKSAAKSAGADSAATNDPTAGGAPGAAGGTGPTAPEETLGEEIEVLSERIDGDVKHVVLQSATRVWKEIRAITE